MITPRSVALIASSAVAIENRRSPPIVVAALESSVHAVVADVGRLVMTAYRSPLTTVDRRVSAHYPRPFGAVGTSMPTACESLHPTAIEMASVPTATCTRARSSSSTVDRID